MNSSKEKIISKIRAAKAGRAISLPTQPDFEAAIYKPILPTQLACFKAELETVSGLCTVCASLSEAYEETKKFLQEQNLTSVFCKDSALQAELTKANISFTEADSDFISMQAAITCCECLVARTGSVLVSSASESGRQLNFFPPVHIVMARATQLVDYPADALAFMQEKYGTALPSMFSLVSGPSRTADIEKTLVLGAHGPKVLHVFIYE